jgi:cytochrome c-type biogenesis protein CcmH
MTAFLLIAALMIAVALAFVLVPLLRHSRTATTSADFARRLRALDEARAAGVIDADEYARKHAALGAPSASHEAVATRSRAAFAAILAVALLLPASALLIYRLVGAPQALDPANLAAAPPAEQAAAMEEAIAGLAAKLKQQPDDPQGWALLARAYQATNRMDLALDAFKQAHERAKDDADITVEYAQALALAAPDHRIRGEPRTLLEAALKIDPKNQRGLWLLGISEYQDEKYDSAIATWKTLQPLLAPDSEVARSVRNEIAEAEARRDGREPPVPQGEASETVAAASPGAPNTAVPMPAPSVGGDASNPAAQAVTTAPRLTVQVALDPKLKDQLDPNATLFVFARAASGPPMPLAIQRLKAGQLPITVTLDDSMSMMPAMTLSKFPQVVVGARVSKSGNAMAQSGDLQVLSASIDVRRAEPVALSIDQVVP